MLVLVAIEDVKSTITRSSLSMSTVRSTTLLSPSTVAEREELPTDIGCLGMLNA